MKLNRKKILITGGAGFIGSHLIRYFVKKYPLYKIYNLDALTYAGNLENLDDIKDSENYKFLHGNICDESYINSLFNKYKFDAAFGGARRDEEKSRAKERIFSFRDKKHRWDPKNQKPELLFR